MTKRINSKHKVDRRLKANLWGRPKSPFNVRAYPPGQHGQNKKGKPTDYGIQLQAKQKLKAYYGNINERQFRNIDRKALSKKGDTSENLIVLFGSAKMASLRSLPTFVMLMSYAATTSISETLNPPMTSEIRPSSLSELL